MDKRENTALEEKAAMPFVSICECAAEGQPSIFDQEPQPDPPFDATLVRADGSTLPNCDLAHVILRVKRLHPSLSEERFEEAERQYREYWAEIKADPTRKMQPTTSLVDDVWHTHIYLDTRQYGVDCKSYFGYFLHHAAICDAGGCSHGISGVVTHQ